MATSQHDLINQILERASSPGYDEWWAKVGNVGYCTAPVELTGRRPDGTVVTILTRCKNRRASVCPSCSALYSGDTWQLVHQGIAVSDEGGDRGPMVFATLTAPSFGAVHTTGRSPQTCRPGSQATCRHGRSTRCHAIHQRDDRVLGEPLCRDCYVYDLHVLFSWYAPALWHRFTVVLRRLVKKQTAEARVSYVKVVELQRRGVPHFHAVIRLDTQDRYGDHAALLGLVHQATRAAYLEVPSRGGELVTLRFGPQTDVRPLRLGDDQEGDRKVASYLAKYVTKSVADFGLSPRRISPLAVGELDVRQHVRSILTSVVDLAADPGPDDLARWLHTLGYRGHITTKTRAYSTTMGALRSRRAAWRSDLEGSEAAPDQGRASGWELLRVGHRNDGELLLTATAAAASRASRLAAREATSEERRHGPL